MKKQRLFHKLWMIALIGLLVLPAAAQEAPAKTKPKAEPPPKFSPYYHQRATHSDKLPDTKGEIIFLGDSITDGGNWTEMLQDLRVKNRGISGDVTEGVLPRLREITRAKPAKLFLMIGINDLARGKTPRRLVGDIRKIVSRIKKRSPETVIHLQSLLPVNPDLGMFKDHTDKTAAVLTVNKRLKKMAETHKLIYIDLHTAFAGEGNKLKPEYTNDGLHLTGAGYELWRGLIEKYLK